MTALSDRDFGMVRDYLLANAGLSFEESRRPGLSTVIAERVSLSGAAGVPDYLGALDRLGGDAERQRLFDAVIVGETHFFRNTPQMEALRRRVLPELLRRAGSRDRPLTIWSAGCSTGEEPYTLAMLVLELSPMLASQAKVRIVGTDLSSDALRAARRATYVGRTLDATPSMVRDRWFEQRPGGAMGVKEQVTRLVELRLHNLAAEPPPFAPGEVDLIVCRNVTIYFDRPTTAALMGSFHDVLADGGYLLLGHSETLWQVSDAFSLLPMGDAFVYRKALDAAAPAPTSRRRRGAATLPPAVAGSVRVATASSVAAGVSGVPAKAPPPGRSGEPAALVTARRHLGAGEYPAAARSAETALVDDSLLSPAYVVLGRARGTLGQDTAAVEALRKAVYLDPGAGDAHFLLAGALARLGHHGAAAVSFRAAAASLGDLDAEARDELLGGREIVELVALCHQLAQVSAGLAPEGAVAPPGVSGAPR